MVGFSLYPLVVGFSLYPLVVQVYYVTLLVFGGYFCKVVIPFCLPMPWVQAREVKLQKWQNLPPGLKFIGESLYFLPIFPLKPLVFGTETA